jgi:lysophospholipase L1-like esterase
MPDLYLLSAGLLTQGQVPYWQQPEKLPFQVGEVAVLPRTTNQNSHANIPAQRTIASAEIHSPEFSQLASPPHGLVALTTKGVAKTISPRAATPSQAPVPVQQWYRQHHSISPANSQFAVTSPVSTVPFQPMSPHLSSANPASQPFPDVADPASAHSTRPTSGSQLYQQRIATLRAGRTYTRIPADSFQSEWIHATRQPTYEEWINLLALEAKAMVRGQGSNRLTVMVGDSISLWFPVEQLPRDRFWLNQGISGDTSAGVLRRLSAFANARPDSIHVMVGVNDLRRGATDTEILSNVRQIMQQLRQTHPQAKIYIHSILPTRLAAIPTSRVSQLNQSIAAITQEEGVEFLNLVNYFSDDQGNLRHELTTDGLHLNLLGYSVWDWAMRSFTV